MKMDKGVKELLKYVAFCNSCGSNYIMKQRFHYYCSVKCNKKDKTRWR